MASFKELFVEDLRFLFPPHQKRLMFTVMMVTLLVRNSKRRAEIRT